MSEIIMSGQDQDSCNCRHEKKHDHEILGSTQIAERCECAHNHRFATVSDVEIKFKGSHVHKVNFRTDSFDGHYHEFSGQTGIAIPVGDGRHVHYLNSTTDPADGHTHEFKFATLIEDPIEEKDDCEKKY